MSVCCVAEVLWLTVLSLNRVSPVEAANDTSGGTRRAAVLYTSTTAKG